MTVSADSIPGTVKRTNRALTSSACSTCGEECAVGVFSAVKVFGEWKTWRECSGCFLRDEQKAVA